MKGYMMSDVQTISIVIITGFVTVLLTMGTNYLSSSFDNWRAESKINKRIDDLEYRIEEIEETLDDSL